MSQILLCKVILRTRKTWPWGYQTQPFSSVYVIKKLLGKNSVKFMGEYQNIWEHIKKKTSCKNNHVDMPSLESFHHWAYFLVHSLAWSLYFFLSVLYRRAISGTRGSSGFGSVSSEQMDRRTFEMVRAGDHWLLRMSRQMLPLLLMFGWYILVVKATLGGLKG